jgi:dethiobiotin synthetase
VPTGNKAASASAPVVFIAGTDTGVGKTLLTALLLCWLRETGVNALAVKLFSSGGTGDARLLQSLQPRWLQLDEIAPYRYRLPLAPAVAAECEGHEVSCESATRHIQKMRARCQLLLVEGCGGLLTPLGRNYSFLELIQIIGGHTIVVAPNRLGAINQVMLAVRVLQLQTKGSRSLAVALMNVQRARNPAVRTNAKVLSQLLRVNVETIRHFTAGTQSRRRFAILSKILQKTLAGLLPSDTVCPLR